MSFLQVKPPCSFTPEETEYLTNRIQDGGTEVVQVGLKHGIIPYLPSVDFAQRYRVLSRPKNFSNHIQPIINCSICFRLMPPSIFFNYQ